MQHAHGNVHPDPARATAVGPRGPTIQGDRGMGGAPAGRISPAARSAAELWAPACSARRAAPKGATDWPGGSPE
jgi:hypothetical protein